MKCNGAQRTRLEMGGRERLAFFIERFVLPALDAEERSPSEAFTERSGSASPDTVLLAPGEYGPVKRPTNTQIRRSTLTRSINYLSDQSSHHNNDKCSGNAS